MGRFKSAVADSCKPSSLSAAPPGAATRTELSVQLQMQVALKVGRQRYGLRHIQSLLRIVSLSLLWRVKADWGCLLYGAILPSSCVHGLTVAPCPLSTAHLSLPSWLTSRTPPSPGAVMLSGLDDACKNSSNRCVCNAVYVRVLQLFDYLGTICATCTLGGLPKLPPSPRLSTWCVDDGAGGQGAGQWTYRVLPHG